jgi:hypothetical protein
MERHLQTPPDQRPLLAARVREFVAATHSQERQFRFVADLIGAPVPTHRHAGPRARVGAV